MRIHARQCESVGRIRYLARFSQPTAPYRCVVPAQYRAIVFANIAPPSVQIGRAPLAIVWEEYGSR